MTEPTPEFSDPVTPQPSTAFGPDHTKSTEDIARDAIKDKVPPKVNQKNPPKPGRSAFASLGQNKKLRSPIRRLTDQDRDKIASLYTFGAMGLMAFKPKAAQAMALSADKCADAWMELAQENDSVRRVLLMIVEGGVWGKVFAAHTPILIALLPDNVMPPMFQGVDWSSLGNTAESFMRPEDTNDQ